jgi:biotin transport system substrate-specific component
MTEKTNKMILVSLFTALTVVGAFIRIPVPPVPFTLQVFFVIFSGLLLGSRLAFASQAIYIALGLAGVPVFANGAGIQYIFNPTFGYLIGFAITALVVGAMTEKNSGPSFKKYFVASFIGMLIYYSVGVLYLYIILKYVNHVSTSISAVLVKGFLLFLPWDIAKIFAASWMAVKVYGRVNIGRGQSA